MIKDFVNGEIGRYAIEEESDGYEVMENMVEIAKLSQTDPEKVLASPRTTPVRKIDEVTAARQPDLNFKG